MMLYISKGFMLTVFVSLIVTTAVLAEGFKVAGKISFEKTGDLYVALVTEEELKADEKSENKGKTRNTQKRFKLIIKTGKQNQKTGKASFAFTKVPQGVYCIRAFQDVNGNGKLDKGSFGPTEPWGNYRYSRPLFRAPEFKEMAFEVNKDINGIEVRSEK